MNLDELRSAQAKERRKDSLQHLRDSFYDDVGAYVADLRAARDRRAEQVENPFADDDVSRLSDEVETAEEVAEALYERRVGKVVKLASFAAADMSVDEEGMTTEERRLFDDLVERIAANKSTVLDVLAGETAAGETAGDDSRTADGSPAAPDRSGSRDPAPGAPSDDATDSEGAPAASDALAGAMGGGDAESSPNAPSAPLDPTDRDAASPAVEPTDGAAADGAAATGDGEPTPVPPESAPPGAVGVGDEPDGVTDEPDDGGERGTSTDGGAVLESTAGEEPAAAPESNGDTDRATVRITKDVGAIFGVDEREYELANEDVVSLPVENADPLVQRDAAERID